MMQGGCSTTESCEKKMTAFDEKVQRIDKACNVLDENITMLEKVFQPVLKNYITEKCCEDKKDVEPDSKFDKLISIIEREIYKSKERISNIIERSAI